MNTQQNQQYTPALGGFFTWLGRAVKNVANAVVKVSHNPFFVINILQDAFDGNGFTIGNGPGINHGGPEFENFSFRTIPTQEVNLTAMDENKLDVWVNNKFIPFFTEYFAAIKDFNTHGVNLRMFIAYYNNAQEFIGLLSWYKVYVLTNPDYSFTQEALSARNQFLTIQINLLNAEIEEYMSAARLSLEPQQRATTFSTAKYAQLGLNIPSSVTLNKKVVSTPPVEIGDEILPTVVPEASGTTQTQQNNKSGGVLLFWTLLAIGLYQLGKSKEDNNEKTE